MAGYELARNEYPEVDPPEIVAVDNEHWLHLDPIGSHAIDVRHLPRPLDVIGDSADGPISDTEHEARDSYIAHCEEAFSTVWHETEMFIATTSINEWAILGDSTMFDTRLVFDELIQNAFRHGGRPRGISINLVRATDYRSDIPQSSQSSSPVQVLTRQVSAIAGNRVLFGVQDTTPGVKPNWYGVAHQRGDELSENLRGLDIVRGVSKAMWYQSDRTKTKWVWALI